MWGTDNTVYVVLQVVSHGRRGCNLWRFFDGGIEFVAEVADERFLSSVESGNIRIDIGKLLPVDLRMIQSFEGEREQLHTEYRVMKVHDRFRPFGDRPPH